MYTSTVQSSKNVYTDSHSHQSSTQQTELASNTATKAYSLDISDEAKGLSKNSKTDNVNDLQVPDGVPPVEAYAIPQWQVDLLPKELLIKHIPGESCIGSSIE